jgi:hypothetical protein
MNGIEKAIETLKMENELMQFNPLTGEIKPIELQNQDNQDLYNANLIAISALEKQMPKKIKKFTYPKNIVYMYCPECDEGIDENNLFCSRCGQKLDWEVESEQRS